MAITRWSRVRRLAEGALARDPEERAAFIDEACVGEPELRDEVADLLRAADRADAERFLSGSAAAYAEPLLRCGVDDHPDGAALLGSLSTALADRYDIVREVGRGGTAIVFLARDRRHDRDVAVKVLRPDVHAQLSAARFLAEIRLTARLAHPYILPLHDSGSAGGMLYYVMPFVAGRSLRARLDADGTMAPREAAAVLRNIASALAHAHVQGIVHCDIKPENILLMDGHAVVADFGIARAISQAVGDMGPDPAQRGAAAVGGTSLRAGTPWYMAPEQVHGRLVDPRTDLYALGVVAREMLFGRSGPPPAGSRTDRAEATLSALGERMTAVDPEDRPASAAEVIAALDSLDPPARNSRVLRLAIAAGLCVLLAVGYALSRGGTTGTREFAEPTIAVLPFENDGPAGDDPLVLGIGEELGGTLAAGDGIRVIGRTSTRRYATSGLTAPAFGALLGVRAIVEGGVRRDGDRLRVTVQLVDVESSTVEWSSTYDRETGDLHDLQWEIARDIAAALHVPPRPRDPPDPTVDLDAREAYTRGRYVLATRLGRDALLQAVEHFEHAVARAPGYARAWAGLANAHTLLGALGYEAPGPRFAAATAAANRALALDDGLAEAHEARAHLLAVAEYEYGDAERAFRRALELDPGYTQARVAFAILLHTQRRFREAIEQLDTAGRHDPLAPAVAAVRGRVFVSAGMPDSAIVALRGALELNPRLDVAHQQLAYAHLQRGEADDAITAMRAAAAFSGARDSAQLAYLHAVTGSRDEAEEIVRVLRSRIDHPHLLPFHIGMAYAGLGERDSAFAWLERGAAEHASFMTGVAATPAFVPLHSDPRWRRLLVTLRLPN